MMQGARGAMRVARYAHQINQEIAEMKWKSLVLEARKSDIEKSAAILVDADRVSPFCGSKA